MRFFNLQLFSGINKQKTIYYQKYKQIYNFFSSEPMDSVDQISPIIAQNQNGDLSQVLSLAFKILVISVILFACLKRKKRDLKKQKIKQQFAVPLQKIIVAIQPRDFFVHIQNKLKSGYQVLQSDPNEIDIVQKTISSILGLKLCFKYLFASRQIINFVRGLKSIQKLQLMIYTSLKPGYTDSLLKKLKLNEYFPPQNRKFCDPKQADMLKHAIDVDKQSRRVVIITPSKKDHCYEDQKYFLVLNPKGGRNKNFLRDSMRIIKNLVQQNENYDQLHDELAQYKIDVEQSDMSDMSDIQKQMN